MLLLIDNYDSFTYNVARYLTELNAEVNVVRNNDLSVDDISALSLSGIVISPGPCTPVEAGISVPVIKALHVQVPILGICLGHQCIAQAFGGKVIRATKVMHGKLSDIYHDGRGIFKGLPVPFCATRYHSLVVDAEHLPEELEITAWTQNARGEREDIMGLKHKNLPVEGVQFHPESILSEHGHRLLQNFLDQSERR